MPVIERAAKFRMVVEIDIVMAEMQQPAHHSLDAAHRDVLAVIGIGHVGGGWRQERDLWPFVPGRAARGGRTKKGM